MYYQSTIAMKILLVDDHQIIRNVLGRFLRQTLKCELNEANNGIEGLKSWNSSKYNLVIVDINMPEMDGIEMTKRIIEQDPEAKVIALSMMDDSVSIKKMLKAGASAYVLKEGDTEDLLMAIDKVMKGEKFFSQAVTETIMSTLSNSKHSLINIELTKRELQVLELIFKEKTNQEIADDLFISLRTVETHKHNILEKTGAKNIAGLVKYAIKAKLFDDLFY